MAFTKDFEGAIGIDLGTTYSCVAAQNPETCTVEVFSNDQGNRTTPSYVAFKPNKERLVGDAAKNQAAMNAKNTIFDAKRLIGRGFDDESVKSDRKLWPFEVVDVDGSAHIKVECLGEVFSPQAISAMVLTKMKEIAEMRLGANVKKAVITVPAYFNDSQRQATKDAGALAGLEVLRIINEPTAAAIAYGLDSRQKDSAKEEKTILIFDLGGGTFDVSLLKISDGVFKVLATAGNTHLGGEDFDNVLVNHFIEDFKNRHGKEHDIASEARAVRRLRSACERTKRSLSTMTNAPIEIDSLYAGIDYTASITRAKFEELNMKAFMSTLEPVTRVLADANIKNHEIDDIVLVGGSTRIPKIQSILASHFGKTTEQLNKTINPDEAVAYGAAVQAALLTGTMSKGGELLLLDIVPLSLGVELEGQIMGVVVPRNTSIPTIKKRVFTTTHDNQTTVEFPIYEGERASTTDNNMLGEFKLSGLPPAPRGVPELETVFEIDANGILKVTATELTSGRSAAVSIKKKPGSLSSEKISRMVEEGERFKEADAEFSSRVQARQSLKEYIYQAESTLREGGVAARLKSTDKVIEELSSALEWLEIKGQDAPRDEIQSYQRKLEAMVNKAFSSLYSQGNNRNNRSRRG